MCFAIDLYQSKHDDHRYAYSHNNNSVSNSMTEFGWPRGTAICVFVTLMQCVPNAWAVEKLTLWPTIFFLRGQDLCQFQDAYGSSRKELVNQALEQLTGLIALGVNAPEAVYAIQKMDALVDKNKAMATEGFGMDITLEATLKASVNSLSRNINPQNTRLEFANPASHEDILDSLRKSQRFDSKDIALLSKVKGFVWGTYSYSPGCKGDVLVTLHVVLPKGESVSFQDVGRPEAVMRKIAAQMVMHFQKTSFPSMVIMGNRILVLVGAPGSSINQAPNPSIARQACQMVQARLPTENEYEYLSILGDWNGGVSLNHMFWALPDRQVLSPDTRNPTPVRSHAEVQFAPVNFYCVK